VKPKQNQRVFNAHYGLWAIFSSQFYQYSIDLPGTEIDKLCRYMSKVLKISSAINNQIYSSEKSAQSSFSGILDSQMLENEAFEKAFQFVTRNNRGFVSGKNPMKFGIMQSTLQDYDPHGKIAKNVASLDENKAKLIYRKIWERAGCNKMPYPLSVIHFDTYVQRPSTAIEALKKSKGQPSLYIDTRKRLLSNLKNYHTHSQMWNNNITQLMQYVELNKPYENKDAVAIEKEQKDEDYYFEIASSFVLKQEGSKFVPNDNGKGPSKFGILQSTLKIYDPDGNIATHVRELNDYKAKKIYKLIWDDAGCENLQFPLNIIHFDSFVHNPRNARHSLRISDGDPSIYLENRSAFLQSLKSYRYFGKAWENRLSGLSKFLQDGVIINFRKKI